VLEGKGNGKGAHEVLEEPAADGGGHGGGRGRGVRAPAPAPPATQRGPTFPRFPLRALPAFASLIRDLSPRAPAAHGESWLQS
jgi:hypothetical protein